MPDIDMISRYLSSRIYPMCETVGATMQLRSTFQPWGQIVSFEMSLTFGGTRARIDSTRDWFRTSTTAYEQNLADKDSYEQNLSVALKLVKELKANQGRPLSMRLGQMSDQDDGSSSQVWRRRVCHPV